jgi:DNA polymerase III epsilon subunit-like protein
MINYYILDTETTGTKCGYHEITEISVIRCSDRNQMTKFIMPEHPERVAEAALQATGRSYNDLLVGSPKEDVVNAIDQFFNKDESLSENRCIVGHNISKFDRKFLYALWGSVGKTFPANLWLDTIPFIKSYMKKFGIQSKKYNLQASLEILGIQGRTDYHNAKADTQNNYLLWKKLMESNVDYLSHIERVAHRIEEDNGYSFEEN